MENILSKMLTTKCTLLIIEVKGKCFSSEALKDLGEAQRNGKS